MRARTRARAGARTGARTGAAGGESREVVRVAQRQRSPAGMAAKRVVQALMTIWVLPRLLIYGVSRLVWGGERAFAFASESLGRVPGARGLYMRQAFYRLTLAECGRDVYFGWLSAFSNPRARIGEGAYVGRRCGVGYATIGAEAMLADGVQVLSGGRQHATDRASGESFREQVQEYRHVEIGAGAWLGAAAIVMADVGEQTVVGAGSVVNRALPAGVMAAGVPARVIRSRDAAVTDSA